MMTRDPISTSQKATRAGNAIYSFHYAKKTKRLVYIILIALGISLFLPWTQTVSSTGKVTTLRPENRPQVIHSRISGRIERWYIREGDHVKKNDTIAYISEIKDDYFDPKLIERSQSQIKSKEATIESYEQKIASIDLQIDALNKSLILKMEQARNKIKQAKLKITTDSIEMITAAGNLKIADDQLKRYDELLSKGVISKTDYENRKLKLQEGLAKRTSSENKFVQSQNELINAQIELNSVEQEYNEKLMKSESDKFSALSALYDSEASLTKMQSQITNYSIRIGYYYVLAPQDGFISKMYTQGIGEVIKEGSNVASIVPISNDISAELYVDPIDLPLLKIGQQVQLQFDGWPAFVFTGWPGVSYGSYSANVISIDRVISDNGKFRILVVPTNGNWPDALQVGGGVRGFFLLKNVPVIYEVWRKINGFPPEFYHDGSTNPSTNIYGKDYSNDKAAKK